MKIINDEVVTDTSYANYTYGILDRFVYLRVESINTVVDDNFSITFGTGSGIPEHVRGVTYNLIEKREVDQITHVILERAADESE